MGKFLRYVLPLIILVGAVAGSVELWNSRPQVEAKPPEAKAHAVAAVTVEHRDVRPTMALYGAIIAGREVELRPLAAGRVVAVGGAAPTDRAVKALRCFRVKPKEEEEGAEVTRWIFAPLADPGTT